MCDLRFVHIGDIDRSVGAGFDFDRAETWIGRSDRVAEVFRLEGRTVIREIGLDDAALQRFDAE